MREKKLLLIGYGDIAMRCAKRFAENSASVTAIARTPKPLEAGDFWQGAVADPELQNQLAKAKFDIAIITLTPGERSDEAYRQTYVENSRRLIALWREHNNAPGLVIFVSSTSVYGQSGGEWIDENSRTEPEGFAGRRLLEAERLWQRSEINTCVVRFSGIYGPGRNHLIGQVKAGRVGGENYTNRIHADDCAGVLEHICLQHIAGGVSPDLLLASDCEPAPARQVGQWLARQMGLVLSGDVGTLRRAGNKRCSNQRLLASGYVFKYPTYREGYRDMLNSNPSGE